MPAYIDIHSHSRKTTAALRIVNSDPQRFDRDVETLPYVSIGVHPWDTGTDFVDATLEWIAQNAAHPKVLAIGECGLDRRKGAELVRQEMILERQIGVAEALGKPMILHCVRAFDVLGRRLKFRKSPVAVIVHGFDQNPQIARQLSRNGIYLSFGKALIRRESNAAIVLRAYPPDLIFLETDDAEMSIEQVYRAAAEILRVEESWLVDRVHENFTQVFGPTPPKNQAERDALG